MYLHACTIYLHYESNRKTTVDRNLKTTISAGSFSSKTEVHFQLSGTIEGEYDRDSIRSFKTLCIYIYVNIQDIRIMKNGVFIKTKTWPRQQLPNSGYASNLMYQVGSTRVQALRSSDVSWTNMFLSTGLKIPQKYSTRSLLLNWNFKWHYIFGSHMKCIVHWSFWDLGGILWILMHPIHGKWRKGIMTPITCHERQLFQICSWSRPLKRLCHTEEGCKKFLHKMQHEGFERI